MEGNIVFDSANENNEVIKKYNELWDGIKNDNETINSGKQVNMIKISRRDFSRNLTLMIIYH